MRVIPNYKVDRSRRYLDVLCFPEGKVILHGYYDYNYSFCYIEVDIGRNDNLSYLVGNIFWGEWDQFYPYVELKRVVDEHLAYRLKYILDDGRITKNSLSAYSESMCTLANDENVGKVIEKAIIDVYAEKVGYDENQVISRLIDMKKRITESEDLLFKENVLPIERELSKIQYLIFGSGQIRTLYKECQVLCENKYNAYMTLVR